MARNHRKNRHVEAPAHKTGPVRRAFNALLTGASITALVYAWEASDEKPGDKTVHSKTEHTSIAQAPKPVKYPAALAPLEEPADPQGITPYPDADIIVTKASHSSYAEGMISIENNDPVYEESMALAEAELRQLQLTKKRPNHIAAELEQNPVEERIEDMQIAPAVKSDAPDEWVSIESFNGKPYPEPQPPKKLEPKIHEPKKPYKAPAPAIKQPAGKTAPVIKAEKPADPKIVARTANSALPQFVKRDDKGDHIYTVGSKIVPMPDKVIKVFRQVAREKNLPIEVLIATCARESYCQPKAVNTYTKACGLFQFMPTQKEQTLFRVAYNYGPAHGYPQTRKLVTQYVHAYNKYGRAILHYAPKNAAAAEQLADLCLNEHFNTSMFGADLRHHIGAYEGFLKGKQPTGREAVIGEIVLMNNLGAGGMQNFFQQVMRDKKSGHDTMARDFFNKLNPSIAVQNPSLVKYPDTKEYYTDKSGKIHEVNIKGRDKTMREAYDLVSQNGGWKTIAQLTPSREL